ncbi:MoxR family ATPase [Roseiconus lacunae]|uniref:MoxR family ATPase n=2 Tax=Roseiconus lacunae TaxID=2605694 RepID=A0ABT7PI07_9BACT|nr:MoxR family ATPase [Roseiconus lacunae]MCD0461312.1 MoxR family ATPase [Roseiconus lacunae]MDM4016139.1 MoxR family ATPase [Roseiconus lacunae]WRQ51527.1 MoxR family ATPase [Stieleria sp. HD01]
MVQPPPIESNTPNPDRGPHSGSGSGDSNPGRDSRSDAELASELVKSCKAIRHQVAQVVVGQNEVVEQLLIAILSRGHCLLEGVPGLAKTLMIRTLAESMHLDFHRIQFTPDLMPGDITGTDIIQEDPETGRRKLLFERGPIFTQMLLADEINRTPPKTQAALLEAMQEHEVTAGGKTYSLKEPFFVLATQNPIEQEGTYPLPEAQRDRFLFHVVVDYPTRDEESEIVDRTTSTFDAEVKPVVTGEQIIAFQRTVRRVPLPPHVKDWVLDAVRSVRPSDPQCADWAKELVEWGPGPRASQQLVLAAKARALMHGRPQVTLEDVQTLALPVLRHRLVPTFTAEADGITVDDLITRLIKDLAPKQASAL